MKDTFRGRYRPTPEQFAGLWNTASIAMDASVLLATYEYSARARQELFGLFEAIKERIWVPYRYAEEFQTRRLDVISRQVSSYEDARKTLQKLIAEHFKVKTRHPFVSKNSLSALERVCKELQKAQGQHEKLFNKDPHFEKISELLEDRIGNQPSPGDISTAIEDGRKRYDAKIPPGFMDNKKPEPEKFGDYFGWRELLNRGKEKSLPLILVTNDTKEDWWHFHGPDRRIGPRHELIEEYFNYCGQPFYLYSLAEFMRYAKTHLNQAISPSTLQEVEEMSTDVAAALGDLNRVIFENARARIAHTRLLIEAANSSEPNKQSGDNEFSNKEAPPSEDNKNDDYSEKPGE